MAILLDMRSFLSLLVFVAFLSFAGSAQAATLAKPANNLGLIGYWPLDEGAGTKIRDISGNNNAGILYNATDTPWGAGKYGGAITFDGLNDMVAVPDAPRLQYTGGDMTISAWIKPDVGETTGGTIISKPWNGSGQYNYWLSYTSNGKIRIHLQGTASYELLTTGAVSPGTYHYIVAVVASDATVKIYIDGVLQASGPDTVSDWTPSSGDSHRSLCIGSYYCYGDGWAGNTGYSFAGAIDDVRIYNRALSSAEIANLYNTGAARVSTADRNGLIGEWKFDEGGGTAAIDSSNQKNNGTVVNGAWVNGKHGSALSFNGSNSYVLVGSPSGPSGAATIAAWIYKNVNTPWSSILDRFGSESLDCLALGFDNSTGKKLMFLWNATSADSWANKVIGTSDIPTGQWVHVAASSNGSTVTFYVNGVPDGTASSGAPCTTGNMYIGVNYAGSDEYFNGKIDDLYLYGRALSAAEIQELYQEGAVRINVDTTAGTSLASGLVGYWSFNGPDVTDKVYDRSGQGNNGYFIGGATSSAKTIGKVGQALKFDGVSSYVQTYPNPMNVGSQMTISVWVKPDAYPNDGQIHEVYRQEELSETTNNYGGYLLSWRGDLNQRWDWGIRQSNVTSKYPYSPTTADVPAGVWTHLVLTADGTNVRGYINGVLKGTVSYDGTISDGRNLIIGAYAAVGGSKARFFPGSIDEMRIYNRALSAAEVKQLYLAGK
jgi:hypothetical protein